MQRNNNHVYSLNKIQQSFMVDQDQIKEEPQ